MLYLSALALGITGVVGVVLAYVWRSEQPNGWEASHYTYLIRGFWLWLAGCVVGMLLLVVVIGVFILLAAFALIVIRAILSISARRTVSRCPTRRPGWPDAAPRAAPKWRIFGGFQAAKK